MVPTQIMEANSITYWKNFINNNNNNKIYSATWS